MTTNRARHDERRQPRHDLIVIPDQTVIPDLIRDLSRQDFTVIPDLIRDLSRQDFTVIPDLIRDLSRKDQTVIPDLIRDLFRRDDTNKERVALGATLIFFTFSLFLRI